MKRTFPWSPAALLLLTAAFLATGPLFAQQSSQGPRKKLIEYGWDVPYPDQVRNEIGNMEKLPFDGVIFRLREWNHAFDPRPWDEAQLKPQFDDLAAIQWSKFTDNFLCLYAANNWKMDWFNDEQWKGITANLRLSAKAAKIGHCVGVVFDPEPYGDNPWAYSAKDNPHSFAEVEAQVQKRGAEFMTALQSEMPNLRLLTFFHQSLYGGTLDLTDAQEREKRLSQHDWGLLSAFWNGALGAAAPGVRIIDGYEPAYYFTHRDQFVQTKDLIRRRSLSVVPPVLRDKHASTVQVGMALYVDQVYALRQPAEQYASFDMTPTERARWFEHNVYYALSNSDEYVWCYSERMNWWKADIPEGAEAAIRSAHAAVAEGRAEAGERLSSELAASLDAAKARAAERAKAKEASPKPEK
jgi:hypothetical protein